MGQDFYLLPGLGLALPPDSSSGWAAFHSKAFWISGGIGGGTGKCAPCGWKPPSLAVYVTWIWAPSGAVYWKEPWASPIGSWEPAFFNWPVSWAAMPLSVSKLITEMRTDQIMKKMIYKWLYFMGRIAWNNTFHDQGLLITDKET